METVPDLPALIDAPTPALVVDRAVLDANIAGMAQVASAAGATLRPHVKTHKSVEIARRQVAAGAHGITVATVAEAEAFVGAGFDDVFVAYPLWVDDARGARLAALTERAAIAVGCDSAAAATRLAEAVGGAPVRVLVEVDSGHHRTGVCPARAGEVARAARDAGLEVVGVFTFPGHSYGLGQRAAAALQERRALSAAAGSLRAYGMAAGVVSGGSSPSMAYVDSGVCTEWRPGAYVFNDAQQWELGACAPEQIALTAYATVVSRGRGRVVLDAGSKTLAADRPAYASGHGRLLDHPDARIVQLSEHHAVAEFPSGHAEEVPALGSIVRVVPNHCCNAVNLADELVVVDEGRQVDCWRIDARGANT